jgi:PAS domain S-box-containing protein
METSLRVALNRSEVLLQTTPTAIALVRDRVIVRCNPAMERLFGAGPGALVGCSTRVLFATDKEWHAAGEKFYPPVTHGEIYTGEFEFIRSGGERFWAVTAGRQIEPGSPEMLFAYTDVTAQQNLARALGTARELADAANQAKSSFLATMSHEIRTPMNGVLGMLELLEFTNLDGEQRETLTLARESAVALLRLIDDILDFSKIEAGQLEIRPEPVSLSALANRAATVYAELASRKGLLLECHIDPRIAQAHVADRLRVTQILNNLLSNAIKFTSRGKVSLDVESAERGSQEELVRLRVTDTGIGIPAEHQGRLFQPFVQADSDTTRNFGGTGLGLSICRRLAEMMGGTISLESEAGIGTTMTVLLRLPIADAALIDSRDTARREQPVTLSESGKPANPIGVRILIADDHPVNLTLIQRQLALLGYQTDIACDGIEALEKWKTGRYALLLSDCHMPRMDGYQLAREIRRIEAASGAAKPIPIVACTANALASDAALCFEAGMSDYLTKPITLPALKSKLEHWIVADANAKADETAREIPSAPIAADSAPQASRADRNDAPLDSHTLAEFTGGDDALRREILRQFLVANEADAGELRSILAGENVAAIAKTAHRIKGASRMIGAQSYADVTERIERAARAEDQTTIRECIGEFDREHARLVTYLRAEIGDARTVPDDNAIR